MEENKHIFGRRWTENKIHKTIIRCVISRPAFHSRATEPVSLGIASPNLCKMNPRSSFQYFNSVLLCVITRQSQAEQNETFISRNFSVTELGVFRSGHIFLWFWFCLYNTKLTRVLASSNNLMGDICALPLHFNSTKHFEMSKNLESAGKCLKWL